VKDLIQGEKVSREAVRSIRPGFGLPPRYIEAVVGKTVKCDLPAGTAVSWALLE
jgi:N-acetylneuraminate synthase